LHVIAAGGWMSMDVVICHCMSLLQGVGYHWMSLDIIAAAGWLS